MTQMQSVSPERENTFLYTFFHFQHIMLKSHSFRYKKIQGLHLLSTVNLTQRYGKRVLFDKINITLDVGKRYGLIGANGAGKSTFLKILTGELEQSDGEVQLQPGLKLGCLGPKPVCF